jgi:hypothetical protein
MLAEARDNALSTYRVTSSASLAGDVCHRLFCGAQATSRGEQGANFAESFIRRLVHNGNETLTREECRKFFVGDAFCWEAAQQRGG